MKLDYDAIIFDIDGTLWDSRESITRAWNVGIGELTGKMGTLDCDEFASQFGRTMLELFEYVFPGLPQKQQIEWGNYLAKRENEELVKHPGTLYPNVESTLQYLCEKYPLYIVSNCGFGYIEAMLHGTKLEKYFKGWLCYDDTNAPKNVTLRVLADKYNLKKPVYVGDIQPDADSCKKACIDIIYASYGLGAIKPEDYIAKIDDFSDLCNLL